MLGKGNGGLVLGFVHVIQNSQVFVKAVDGAQDTQHDTNDQHPKTKAEPISQPDGQQNETDQGRSGAKTQLRQPDQ